MNTEINFSDLIEVTQGTTAKQFAIACPYPALLVLPRDPAFEGTLDFDDDPGDRELETTNRVASLADLGSDLRLQFLIPTEPVTVGCQDAAIVLAHRSVARFHAEFTLETALWRLKDLESRRGTRLEGRRIAPGVAVPVVDGQHIGFGLVHAVMLEPRSLYRLATLLRRQEADQLHIPPTGILLKDLVEEAAAATCPGPESGPFLLQIPQIPQDRRSTGAGAGGVTQSCAESKLLGSRRSRTFEDVRIHSLCSDSELVIGRGADCDLVLDEPLASRRHARLQRDGDLIRVIDLRSENGTFVDGKRLPAGITVELRLGQTLRIAGYMGMILGYEQLQEMLSVVDRSQAIAA